MNFKFLKDFFKPDLNKLVMVFFLEFLLTFAMLLVGEDMGGWVYLLSPNALYLESTINLYSSTIAQIAFHGAVANVIALLYLYFLSCLIDTVCKRVRGK
jgi:hypothetical protein